MGRRDVAASGSCAPSRRRSSAMHLLAGLVFVGLWLMHGMSATTEAGCHGVPVLMTMSASATDSGSAMAADAEARTPAPRHDAAAARPAHPGSGGSMHQGSNETCLSGQPPSPGDFLLALLASLAVSLLVLGAAGLLVLPASSVRVRLRRRGPPGLAGRALLTTVCIART